MTPAGSATPGTSRANNHPLDGIVIIDADTHLSEPHDLWTSRAPASCKARVPQVRTVDGQRIWVMDGQKLVDEGGGHNCTIREDGSKSPGWDFWTFPIESIHPSAYNIGARLAYMDQQKIWAQVVYSNVLGFGGQKAIQADAALRKLSIEIYNDAMAELQQESHGRLFPMALLPWWDAKLAAAEAQRAKAMGLRGVNINSDPQQHAGIPDLASPEWDPLWEVCQGLGLPVNFHIGASESQMDWFGSAPWPSSNWDTKLAIGTAALFYSNGRVLMNLILCGLLDRFPRLKFVSVESGIGWIPFVLEALEYQICEGTAALRRQLSLTPSEYFARNFYACFWFERRDLAHAVRRVGVDNVLFETDYPHPTCLYPEIGDYLASGLGDLDRESRRKIMGGNAARLYSIPLPADG